MLGWCFYFLLPCKNKLPWLSIHPEGVDTRKATMTSIAGGYPSHWPAAIQLRAPTALMLPRGIAQPQPEG